MSNSTIEQLRASDFVILSGETTDAKTGKTRAYRFAKIDSRCNLMNNPVFLNALEAEGAKAVVITK
jgi:ethanolamine utilization protein EutP (predicted NTPase)